MRGGGLGGPSKREMAEMDGEDDLRTLKRADDIRSDSKRMAMCQRVLNKQERGLRRLRRSVGGKRSLSKGRN